MSVDTSNIDQQFVEYIVKSLVNNPDQVTINRTIDEKGVLLELTVAPEDLGRVIGRAGATAKSIRTLLRALGVKNDARYNLKIVDVNGGPREQRQEQPAQDEQPQPEGAAVSEEAVEQTQDEPVEQPATVEESGPEAEEDTMQRHRQDLRDLTDLDI